MRYIYLLLFAFVISQSGFGQTAPTVIVKGRIIHTDSTPVSNWPVYIMSDSTFGCNVSHGVLTNANGYYTDTISCTQPLYVIFVTTKDCNGNYITHVDSVPPTVPPISIVEDNFTICKSGTVPCHAAFTTIVNNNVGLFNSSGSTGSSASAIVQRRWSFGDGSTLLGNIISPAHTYNSPGTYIVKLVIVTTNNQCMDSVSQAVVVVQTPSCQAYFIDSVMGQVVYCNSSNSTTGFGDSIVQRRWTFGDNTPPVTGNQVSQFHTYLNGTYNICLKITSARGCIDSFCKTVTINPVPTCSATFIANQNIANPYAFLFNSSGSQATSPDVIIRRKWEFDINDTLGGNLISVAHVFNHAGSYNVKLTIYTQNGCSSTYTQFVNVVDTNCRANFLYNTTPASSLFTFSSTSSGAGSPITSHYWNFGDSTHATTMNPTHIYQHPGTYNVCLTIATASGCQSTKCYTIVVQGTSTCHASIQLASNPKTGLPVIFDSRNSTATQPDTIYQRLWSFGDGSGLSGNVPLPSHVYTTSGSYIVRLIIVSTSGCRDTAYLTIPVVPNTPQCHAAFSDSALNHLAYFYSGNSYTSNQDSIIERRWTFGDGTSMAGNVVNPIHQYAQNGTYTVCLRIISSSGCRDSICKAVVVGNTIPVCTSYFTYTNSTQNTVVFNSTSSYTSPGDSIIHRYWNFGDNIALGANIPNPVHTYAASGIYNVCLTIITAKGCQNIYCKSITIVAPPRCKAIFKYVKLNQNTIKFNSASSITDPTDSIVQRKWTFGDGSSISPNVVSPVKTYVFAGLYNVCLRIQTAKGCVSETCIAVRVGDSTVNVDTSKKVEILSIYPNLATTQFTSLIWSRYSGITAELAIIDIYGIKKWGTRKILSAGNNFYVIPTNLLLTGPYTFRVTTLFGVKSKQFYKL